MWQSHGSAELGSVKSVSGADPSVTSATGRTDIIQGYRASARAARSYSTRAHLLLAHSLSPSPPHLPATIVHNYTIRLLNRLMRPPLPTAAEPLVTYADIRRRSPDTCRRARNSLISSPISRAPLRSSMCALCFSLSLYFRFVRWGWRAAGVAVGEVLERGVARL